MNDSGSPPNSNRYPRERERPGASPIAASQLETGIDAGQSGRFTKLVAEQPVFRAQRALQGSDREEMSPLAGNPTYELNVCPRCAGTMRKSTRVVLSIPAGIGVIVLGIALMTFYGYATNFYQFPWFVRFGLPAVYYIGSILVGVGILFFFIRERVWRCGTCGQVSRR